MNSPVERSAEGALSDEQLKTVNQECAEHLANATDDCISEMRRANRAEAAYKAADKALRRVAGFLASRRRWRFVSVRRVEAELREAVVPLGEVLKRDAITEIHDGR